MLAIGGSVTEIVYALGQGDRLIGRDSTSTFPPEALALPDLGYMRALSPEGVLSVGPDLILADADAGPPEAVAAMKAASVAFVEVPSNESAAGVAAKIRTWRTRSGSTTPARRWPSGSRPNPPSEGCRRRGAGAATGDLPAFRRGRAADGRRRGHRADAMLGLAGAENALAGFEGYKPVSAEAVLAAAPEVVVMMDRGDGHATAPEQVFALPGLAGSPAAAAGALVRMDGLFLLGFGPRTAAAVDALHQALYPDAG